jgi:hypothetical protein
MSRDVERARRTLNFSEWPEHAGLKPAVAASTLMAGCAVIQAKKMPKGSVSVFPCRGTLVGARQESIL